MNRFVETKKPTVNYVSTFFALANLACHREIFPQRRRGTLELAIFHGAQAEPRQARTPIKRQRGSVGLDAIEQLEQRLGRPLRRPARGPTRALLLLELSARL